MNKYLIKYLFNIKTFTFEIYSFLQILNFYDLEYFGLGILMNNNRIFLKYF